mmetsp:Transcript_35626/g.83332  ORF Transcript_35626/g.83332 Transcript_35626/m.83332 type:complete len:361 (-) Transcript_35626:66-1148(-)
MLAPIAPAAKAALGRRGTSSLPHVSTSEVVVTGASYRGVGCESKIGHSHYLRHLATATGACGLVLAAQFSRHSRNSKRMHRSRVEVASLKARGDNLETEAGRAAGSIPRRQLAVASAVLCTAPHPSYAESSEASGSGGGLFNFPGFSGGGYPTWLLDGDGDISYPSWLLGDWKVKSELTSVDIPQGPDFVSDYVLQLQKLTGKPEGLLNYRLSFVKTGNNAIIADRSLNTVPFYKALGDGGEAVEWGGEANPDVVIFKVTRGGFTARVNLRALLKAGDTPEGRSDLYNTREVFFAATEAPAEVTPVIAVTKYKQAGPAVQQILRLEIYPAFGAEGGAQQAQSGDLGQPVAVVKYLSVLSR